MTTRAVVPNGDGEGSLGTASLKWGKIYSSDPATGENSGQVSTTAWVQSLVAKAVADATAAQTKAYTAAIAAAQKQAKLDAHPVGSYYFSDKADSPATLFGGTWEALPAGYTLIAQGSGSDSFGSFTYEAGQKYGERKHQLTTDELPHISGSVWNIARQDSGRNINAEGVFSTPHSTEGVGSGANVKDAQPDGFKMAFGNDQPHNTLPPSIASYGWRRTA